MPHDITQVQICIKALMSQLKYKLSASFTRAVKSNINEEALCLVKLQSKITDWPILVRNIVSVDAPETQCSKTPS